MQACPYFTGELKSGTGLAEAVYLKGRWQFHYNNFVQISQSSFTAMSQNLNLSKSSGTAVE